MNSNRRMVLVCVVAVLVLGSAVAGVITITQHESKQEVFTGETIGNNSYNNPVFDLTLENLTNAGYREGDTFDVVINGVTVSDAILTHGFLGIFMFDTYLNTEKDGHLAAGAFWDNVLPNEVGNSVTITHVGHNDDYDKLDKFLVDYTSNIADYENDEAVFANFYKVTGGDIGDGKLYRSYNPFTTGNARTPYVNKLAEDADIGYIATLSMNSEAIQIQIDKGTSGYCTGLFTEGHVSAANIGYQYFAKIDDVKTVLTGMADNDGPYLVHCNVGRDRTGFVVTLLQALCGASEADMKSCAANAYVNLYHVDPDSEEYKVIVDSTYCRNIYYICNYDKIGSELVHGTFPIDWSSKNVMDMDLARAAHDYCTEYLGMDGTIVDRLISNLSA